MIKALPRKFAPATPPGNWPVVAKPVVVKTSTKSELHRYLQRSLNSMGFTDKYGKPLKVDGVPGNLTMSALAKLQYAAGITKEPGKVGRWSWAVIDWAQYDQWVAAPSTLTVLCDRCFAIYKGHNRYSGLPVNKKGILRETQFMSDAGLIATPYWTPVFVAVDRKTSAGTVSRHRDGGARDWMSDLNKDGNYRNADEISKSKALAEFLASTMMNEPMQTVLVRLRGDGAEGIDDTTVPVRTVQRRFSGRLRLCKVIYYGRICEWRNTRNLDGTYSWKCQWWTLKPSSDQHYNHVHTEVAEVVDGVLYAGVA